MNYNRHEMCSAICFRPFVYILGLSLVIVWGCENKVADENTSSSKSETTPSQVFKNKASQFNRAYLIKADEIAKEYGEKEAIPYYEKAAELYANEGVWEGALIALNHTSKFYINNGSLDTARIHLDTALSIGIKYLTPEHLVVAKTNFLYGRYFEDSNQPLEALIYFEKAIKAQITSLQPSRLDLAASFKGLGDIYLYNLQDHNLALTNYLNAINIWEENEQGNLLNLMRTYYAISSCYRRIGEFENAITYNQKTSQMISKADPDNVERIALVMSDLGNIFQETFQYDQATLYYDSAINISTKKFGKDHFRLGSYYNNIGSALTNIALKQEEVEQHVEAQKNFRKAYQYYLSSSKLYEHYEHPRAALSYFNLGWNFALRKQFDSSYHYYNKSLVMRKEVIGNSNSPIAEIHLEVGKLYDSFDSVDQAIDHYQKALTVLYPEFETNDVLANPKIFDEKSQSFFLADILLVKAKTLLKHYRKNEDRKFLASALETYELWDKANDINRRAFYHEASKLYWKGYAKDNFNDAVEACFELYNKTEDGQYLSRLFNLTEKNKYILLFESLYQAEELGKINVPDSILEFENSIKTKLAYLKQQLDFEESKDKPDDQLIKEYNASQFELTRQQEKIKFDISTNFPEFYDIKNNDVNIDIKSIQRKIDENTEIATYYWGKNSVYALLITKNGVIVEQIPISEELLNSIEDYKNVVSESRNFVDKENFMRFQRAGSKLYEILLKPLFKEQTVLAGNFSHQFEKNLIIVPDGPLSQIPFEAFLTSPSFFEEVNYHNLPYLIRKYLISYAYSTNLLFVNKQNDMIASPKLLGMSFSDYLKKSKVVDANEITGTAFEIDKIKSLIPGGTYLMGENATESKFKSEAGKFDILHLAIHGKTDENPINNRLIFKNNNDSLDDGKLYYYELYNIKLKAKLVVLSACETGAGTQFKGEGIYSMARGFAYAGCPAIIMSYWKANDNVTSVIMNKFYDYLSEGIATDHSLRQAKLDYLENSDEFSAHPSTWAALVPLGNVRNPIFQKKPTAGSFYYFIIGLLIISVIVYILIKNNHQNQKV